MATTAPPISSPTRPDSPAVPSTGAGTPPVASAAKEPGGRDEVRREVHSFLDLDEAGHPQGEQPSVPADVGSAATGSAATEPASPPTAGPQAPSARLVRLLSIPLRPLVAMLVVLDLPFSFLGPGIKNLIGYAAIATTLMAIATWVGGPRLVAAYSSEASPAAQKTELAQGGSEPADGAPAPAPRGS